MGPHVGEREREKRLGSSVSLTFLLGAGVVGTLTFLYMFLTDTVGVETVLPERLIEFLLLGVPAAGLICAGIWLRSAEFSPVRVWRIGQYALGGTAVAALTGGLSVALFPPRPFGVQSLFFLLVSAATEGALLGFLLGWVATSEPATRIEPVHEPRDVRADGRPAGRAAGRSGERSELRSRDSPADRSIGSTDVDVDRDERLEELVSFLSHDLRNPLNVAQLRVDLARKEDDLAHLDSVTRAHDRMDALIEDILRLAGDDDPEVEPVDLAAAVEDAWRNVDTGTATLVVDTDRTVRADRTRLGRLLENLVRNSVEHGSTGSAAEPHDSVEHGRADVTVTVGDLDNGFYVEDDGNGIPPGKREEVFAFGYSTDDGGTGLGLPIVRRIAEEHGWSVTVVEGRDGGARFEITGA